MPNQELNHWYKVVLAGIAAASSVIVLFLVSQPRMTAQLLPDICNRFPSLCFQSNQAINQDPAPTSTVPVPGGSNSTLCDFLPSACQSSRPAGSSAAPQSVASARTQSSAAQSSSPVQCGAGQLSCTPGSTATCPCINTTFTMVCPDSGCVVCPICDPPPPSSRAQSSAVSSVYTGQPADLVVTVASLDVGNSFKGGVVRMRITVQNVGRARATNVHLTGRIPGVLGNAQSLSPEPSQSAGCTFSGMNFDCPVSALEVGANWSGTVAIRVPSSFQATQCPAFVTTSAIASTDIPEITLANNTDAITHRIECSPPSSASRSSNSPPPASSSIANTQQADIVPMFRGGTPVPRIGVNRFLMNVENRGDVRADNIRLFVAVPTHGMVNLDFSTYFCYPGTAGITCEVPSVRPGESVDVDVGFTIQNSACNTNAQLVARVITSTPQLNDSNDTMIFPFSIQCAGGGNSSRADASSRSQVSSNQAQGSIDLVLEEGPNFPVNTEKNRYVTLPYRLRNLGSGTAYNVRTYVLTTSAFMDEGRSSPFCNAISDPPNSPFPFDSRIECHIPQVGPGQFVDIPLTFFIPSDYPRCPGMFTNAFSVQPQVGELSLSNNSVNSLVLAVCGSLPQSSASVRVFSSNAVQSARSNGNGIRIEPRPNNVSAVDADGTARLLYSISNPNGSRADNVYVRFRASNRFTFNAQFSSSNCLLQGSDLLCEFTSLNPGSTVPLDVGITEVVGMNGCGNQYALSAQIETTTAGIFASGTMSPMQTVAFVNVRCQTASRSSAQQSVAMNGFIVRERTTSFPTTGERSQSIRLLYYVQNVSGQRMQNVRVRMPLVSEEFDPALSSSFCQYSFAEEAVICTLPDINDRATYPIDIGVRPFITRSCNETINLNFSVEGSGQTNQARAGGSLFRQIFVRCAGNPTSSVRPRSSAAFSESYYECRQEVGRNVYCVPQESCNGQLSPATCGSGNGRCCYNQSLERDGVTGRADLVLLSNSYSNLGQGDVVTYNLSIRNDGPLKSAEARLYVPVPPGAQLESLRANSRGSCTSTSVSRPYCVVPPTDPGFYVQYIVRIRIPQTYQQYRCPTDASITFRPRVEMSRDVLEQTELNNELALRSRVLCSTNNTQGVCCEAGNCNPFGSCSNPYPNYGACSAACGGSTGGDDVSLELRNGTPNAERGDRQSFFVRVTNSSGRAISGAGFEIQYPSGVTPATTSILYGSCTRVGNNVLRCLRTGNLPASTVAWVTQIDFSTVRPNPCNGSQSYNFTLRPFGATGDSDSLNVWLSCGNTGATSSRRYSCPRGFSSCTDLGQRTNCWCNGQLVSQPVCFAPNDSAPDGYPNCRLNCPACPLGFNADPAEQNPVPTASLLAESSAYLCGNGVLDPGEECDFAGVRDQCDSANGSNCALYSCKNCAIALEPVAANVLQSAIAGGGRATTGVVSFVVTLVALFTGYFFVKKAHI